MVKALPGSLVNSAFHSSGVGKSSTSLVAAVKAAVFSHLCRVAGNTCNPISHVMPHSSETYRFNLYVSCGEFVTCISGDIGFDGIVLPEAHNELRLYAGSVREPNPADVSNLSLSPSESSSSGSAEKRDGETPMEVDAIETVKSPERSRLLLNTSVLDAAPDDADDVYDYGMFFSV